MTTRDKKITISKIGPLLSKGRISAIYDRDDRFVFNGKIRGLVDDDGKPIKE
jgi:hypothetical protein